MTRYWKTRTGTVVVLIGFVLLTLLVITGVTRDVDAAVRDLMRPQDKWGETQVAADVVVEGLRPEVLLAVLLVVGATASALRRSWQPMAFVVLLSAVAAVPALAVKMAVARSDPHYQMSSIGSFPSGHTMFVVVVLGGIVVVTLANPQWWVWLLVGAMTVVMGVALLLQAAHWAADVIGGALLGMAALGATRHYAGESLRRPSPPTASTGSRHSAGPSGSGARARRREV